VDSIRESTQPEYLSTQQVAVLLSIKEQTARALCRKGRLPAVRLGDGPYRVRRKDIERLFDAKADRK
jgi:excisionase family DNA binding protein